MKIEPGNLHFLSFKLCSTRYLWREREMIGKGGQKSIYSLKVLELFFRHNNVMYSILTYRYCQAILSHDLGKYASGLHNNILEDAQLINGQITKTIFFWNILPSATKSDKKTSWSRAFSLFQKIFLSSSCIQQYFSTWPRISCLCFWNNNNNNLQKRDREKIWRTDIILAKRDFVCLPHSLGALIASQKKFLFFTSLLTLFLLKYQYRMQVHTE